MARRYDATLTVKLIGKMASLAWMVFVTTSIHGKEAIAMRFTHSSATRQQIQFLQRQYLQDGDLPFTNVLTNECLAQALDSIKNVWKDRISTPLVTLWVFLGQILSADHS